MVVKLWFCAILAFSALLVECYELASEESDSYDVPSTSSRSYNEDYSNQWRAVETVDRSEDNSGWLPSRESTTSSEEFTPPPNFKRKRRVRKRKRRPEAVLEHPEYDERPRRRRPQRLDEFTGTWTELEAESVSRPYQRRRLTPLYPVEEYVASGESVSATIKFGNEESSDNSENETYESSQDHQTKTTEMPDLKTFLKKSASLSLSEYLQQRNLSLSDLIKGKSEAISALSNRPESTTQTVDYVTETTRLPKFGNGYKKLNGLTNLRKPGVRTRLHEDEEESSTERRIFVPSHPKYYTSLDYKPLVDDDSIVIWSTSPRIDTTKQTTIKTTYEDHTTYRPKTEEAPSRSTSTTPKLTTESSTQNIRQSTKRLPITSAKLHKFAKIQEAEATSESFPKVTILPENAFKINVNQLFGIDKVLKGDANGVETKQQDTDIKDNSTTNEDKGPMKISIDLENMDKPKFESTTPMTIQDKLRNVTAKEEILEILKDNDSKERLSRILKVRNMTIEDLVELRERGSSQRHLADIFHNNTREPEPKSEQVHEGRITSQPIQDLPVLRQPKSQDFSRVTKEVTTPEKGITETNPFRVTRVSLRPLEGDIIDETQRPKEMYSATSFPTYQIKVDKNSPEKGPYNIPVWKTIYPNYPRNEDSYENEITNVDDVVENKIAEAVNEHLNIELEEHHVLEDEEGFFNLPNGVKSAILASLVIIGSSLLIFLTILVIFRWSQKTKRRFCYRSSLNSSRIKSPILEESPRKSIKTFMAETLGRKPYKIKQSMSDEFWETDIRKPYQ